MLLPDSRLEMEYLLEILKKSDAFSPGKIKKLIYDLQVCLVDMENADAENADPEKSVDKGRIHQFKNKYSDMYHFVPIGYLIFDKQGFIKEANLSESSILGSQMNFLTNTPLAHYLFWKDRNKFGAYINDLLNSPQPLRCEVRFLRPDGSRNFARLESIPVKNSKGKLNHFRAIICTERKKDKDKVEKILRIYRVVNKTRTVLFKANKESELAQEICRILVDEGGFCLAQINFLNYDNKLEIMGQWGEKDDLPKEFKTLPKNCCPSSAAVKNNSSFILRDILASPELGPWRSHAVFHGYAACIALPLSINGKITGSLCIYAREPDSFGTEEAVLIEIFAENLSHGISHLREKKKRIKAETDLLKYHNKLEDMVYDRTQELKYALDEKEVLLREIHHRVKNNMQIISSLISIQEDQILDKKIKKMFRENQNRIMVMALIHDNLYLSDSLEKIEMNQYITGVAGALLQIYNAGSRVELKTEINNIFLDIDQAVPCGLIINELLSNSLKYAFPGNTKGKIEIKALINSKKLIQLTLCDNGTGIPGHINLHNPKSLGFQLIRGLVVNQLKGSIDINTNNGSCFCICFSPMKNHRKRI